MYNNTKNASIGHTLFELNYSYHLCIFFENNINLHSKSYSADRMAKQQRDLMSIYQQNLLHAQKVQKQAYDKSVKLYNYTPGEEI